MTDNNLIPPPELVQQWGADWHCSGNTNGNGFTYFVATRAAQWGADCELEACCEWLKLEGHEYEHEALLAARRPKSPSLKEQAHDAYWALRRGSGGDRNENQNWDTIRRALEALPE
jgi:hypothetical protein